MQDASISFFLFLRVRCMTEPVEQLFCADPACVTSIDAVRRMCVDTKRTHIEISLGMADGGALSAVIWHRMHAMFEASVALKQCKSKSVQRSITLRFATGIRRVFVVGGRNAISRQYELHRTTLAVEGRATCLSYVLVATEPVPRAQLKKYGDGAEVVGVTLSECSTYQFAGGWKYTVGKSMSGPTKEMACEGVAQHSVTLTPPVARARSSDPTDAHAASTLLNRGLDLVGRYTCTASPPAAVSVLCPCPIPVRN